MSVTVASAGWSVVTPDAEKTAAIGAVIGRSAPDGALILLAGPLGAGKTTFAQGVGAGCGVRDPITSPTYNLILDYVGDRRFTHVDLYRLEDATELETLGLEEVIGGSGVTCVEWPELLGPSPAPPWAKVRISPVGPGGERLLRGVLGGEGWETALSMLVERGARPE